jgi:uncharacterized protein
MLTEGDIQRIAKRVAAAYQPLAVGIFGSYAIGSATARSDLDLFVIKRPDGALPVDARAVRRLLFDVIHPLDVQVFNSAEFEESVHDYQSFTWVIAQQARLYHWDGEAERALPSLASRATASQLYTRPGITDDHGATPTEAFAASLASGIHRERADGVLAGLLGELTCGFAVAQRLVPGSDVHQMGVRVPPALRHDQHCRGRCGRL